MIKRLDNSARSEIINICFGRSHRTNAKLDQAVNECQAVWIQIRPGILSGLIWVQTVCKSYRQTTVVGKLKVLACVWFPVSRDSELVVLVQGPRPENILFLVHEVFEGLIVESFHGVQYDFLLPCPECSRMVRLVARCFHSKFGPQCEKSVYLVCEHQRHRPACAFAQSDQHLLTFPYLKVTYLNL